MIGERTERIRRPGLVVADTGREREAAGLAIGALARHLPRYNRSIAHYAAELSGR